MWVATAHLLGKSLAAKQSKLQHLGELRRIVSRKKVLPEHVGTLDLGPSDEVSNLLAASRKKRLIGVDVKNPVAPRLREEEVADCREIVSPGKVQHSGPLTLGHFTRVVFRPSIDNNHLIDEALERTDRFSDVCGFVSHQQAEAECVFHAPEYNTAHRRKPWKVWRLRDLGRHCKCGPTTKGLEGPILYRLATCRKLTAQRARHIQPQPDGS